MASLGTIHIVALAMVALMLGFLVYLNIEQVQEYDNIRKEIEDKLAELTCKPKKSDEEPKLDRKHFARIVKDVVGECVLRAMRDVNEYLISNRLRQSIDENQIAPDCDCRAVCQAKPKKEEDEEQQKTKKQTPVQIKEEPQEQTKREPQLKIKEEPQQKTQSRPRPKIKQESPCHQTPATSTQQRTNRHLSQNVERKKRSPAGLDEDDATFACEKCRLECSKRLLSDESLIGMPNCHYSHTHVNYADSQLGARILSVQGPHKPFDCGSLIACFLGGSYGQNPPELMLNDNMEPGSCFAFSGVAYVTIQLAKPILIEIIEIAHIDRCRSPNKDTSSAPKDFTVYGVDRQTGKETFLGDFVYDNSVPSELFTFAGERFELGVLKILFRTNHGNSEYSCVYKVGVYGREL